MPALIKKLSYHQILDLLLFQIKILFIELDALKVLEQDFINLGINPEKVFNLAEAKQLEAFKLLGKEINLPENSWEPIKQLIRFRKNIKDKINYEYFKSNFRLRK